MVAEVCRLGETRIEHGAVLPQSIPKVLAIGDFFFRDNKKIYHPFYIMQYGLKNPVPLMKLLDIEE